MTPDEMKQKAQAWFDRQLEKSRAAMGDEKFAEHREWLEEYLREDLRLRLVAIGWRARNDG